MSLCELEKRYGKPVLYREVNGQICALFASGELRNNLAVYFKDEHTSFVLYPPKFLALRAYKNPRLYAVGAVNGTDNPECLNPVEMAA